MENTARKIRVPDIAAIKERGERIAMMTAYDYTMARLVDESGIEMILVGDSVGMVQMGYSTTLPVTMDDMIHHTRAVSSGVKHALIVADMPFLSYQTDINQAVANAGRFLKEAGADAVKLEGAGSIVPAIARMVEIGIPVVGHLGLTPQSVHKFGGFKVQAKTPEAAEHLLSDALALQNAGVFAIVLESIPVEVASKVTAALEVPTIGIGAGPACDGQVLVCYDALGMFDDLRPRFVKQYARVGDEVRRAMQAFRTEVKEGQFPGPEHSYGSFKDIVKEA